MCCECKPSTFEPTAFTPPTFKPTTPEPTTFKSSLIEPTSAVWLGTSSDVGFPLKIPLTETISSDNLYLTHNSTDPNIIIIFKNGEIIKKYPDSFIDEIMNNKEFDDIKKRIFENIIKFVKDLDDIILTLNFAVCVKNKNVQVMKEIYEKFNKLNSNDAEIMLKILKNSMN